MSNLSAFLAENAVKIDNVKEVVSNRFLNEGGKPIPWEICCITSTEDEVLRKSCVKKVPILNKKGKSIGQYRDETDYNLYACKLAVRCTVFPNLNDASLQDSYGIMGAEELLKTMLTPGEYAQYIARVQEINGFDIMFEDEVDEAKN